MAAPQPATTTIHARAAHTRRHLRPNSKAGVAATGSAQPSTDEPTGPVWNRRISPPDGTMAPPRVAPSHTDHPASLTDPVTMPASHGAHSTTATTAEPRPTYSSLPVPRHDPTSHPPTTTASTTATTSAGAAGSHSVAAPTSSPAATMWNRGRRRLPNGSRRAPRAMCSTIHGVTAHTTSVDHRPVATAL